MLKFDIRLWFLFSLILVSSWYLFSPMFFEQGGVVVVSLEEDSDCGDLMVGDHIVQVGGRYVDSKDDFENVLNAYKNAERLTMVVGWGPGGCTLIEDSDVGIEVSDVPSSFIKFGLDVYGGKRVWLSTLGVSGEAELEEVKNIIEKRSKIAGAPQLKVGIENNILFLDVLDVNDALPLIKNGLLEGMIEQSINFLDGVGQIKLESDYYDINVKTYQQSTSNVSLNETNSTNNSTDVSETGYSNITILVDGEEYGVGGVFRVGGVSFYVLNITSSSAILSGGVFDNKDVVPTTVAASYTKYDTLTRQHQFFVPIELSEHGGQRFTKIVGGLPSVFTGDTSILEGVLVFYLDGEEINRLSLPTNIADQNIRSLTIIGVGTSSNDVESKKKAVEMALVGNIDYDLSIVEVSEYDSGGGWLLYLVGGVGIVLAIVMSAFSMFVYKTELWPKLSFWSTVLFWSTIFNIFGVAATSQVFFNPGWIIDVVSIVGILVASFWVFLSMWFESESVFKRRDLKIKKYLDYAIIILGFVSLFTEFSGVGIAIIGGVVLTSFITGPIYRNILSNYKS